MSRRPRIVTPRSYLDAQKARAKNAAKQTGGNPRELLDLHFHRRLIARVFDGPEARNWVLKGGQAMLVRWPSARYSTDIDLLSSEATTNAAVEALKILAARRLDDNIWFDHLETADQTDAEHPTRKVKFRVMFESAPLGPQVSVDVAAARHLPRGEVTTEQLEPPFTTDSAPWPPARVFPVEDHVAEKICAMYELHGVNRTPSTRYKDLVDLVLFAGKVTLPGAEMHKLIRDESARRRARGVEVELPDEFRLPDERSWTAGYAQAARGVLEIPEQLRRIEHAQALAEKFITPLLRESAPDGVWQPSRQAWQKPIS